jgi:hypothetical protein
VKGNGSKAASSPATEPNFYEMEPCYGRDDDDTDSDSLPSPPGNTIESVIRDDAIIDQETKEFAFIREDEFNEEARRNGQLPLSIAYENDDQDSSSVGSSMTPVPERLPIFFTEDDFVEKDEEETITMKFSNLPPIVSPIKPGRRNVVSQPGSPMKLAPPVSLEGVNYIMELGSEIHSGDQLFFEGLPFHYLEAKDIAEALDARSRQCQVHGPYLSKCII